MSDRGYLAAVGGLLLAACSGGSVEDAAAHCEGAVIVVPPGGATVPQLMAHATAMGMTQREAETLIYLEGLNPQVTVKGGETICLDGRPDREQ